MVWVISILSQRGQVVRDCLVFRCFLMYLHDNDTSVATKRFKLVGS